METSFIKIWEPGSNTEFQDSSEFVLECSGVGKSSPSSLLSFSSFLVLTQMGRHNAYLLCQATPPNFQALCLLVNSHYLVIARTWGLHTEVGCGLPNGGRTQGSEYNAPEMGLGIFGQEFCHPGYPEDGPAVGGQALKHGAHEHTLCQK